MSQPQLFGASSPRSFVINVDGASRGNPGPAAAAWVIRDASDGQIVIEEGRCLGKETNNRAEYFALLFALEDAVRLSADRVLVRSDSELLVRQVNGSYRVKNVHLKPLFERAKTLAASFKSFQIQHVPREENKDADRAANAALNANL